MTALTVAEMLTALAERGAIEQPYGMCQCGCGEKTRPVGFNAPNRGLKRGEPQRYVRGHSGRRAIETRFWQRVQRVDECWQWLGTRDAAGYGSVRLNGRMVKAHRYAYEALIGSIPKGLELDHLCRNRGCVNPEHLEPVTHRENVLRGNSPAAEHARRTHCKNGHELAPSKPGVSRVCNPCRSIARRKRLDRLKEAT